MPLNPQNLDLTSAEATITAGDHPNFQTAVIQVGNKTRTITASDLLTPAENVALHQVLSSGQQILLLSRAGRAVGGQFTVTPDLAQSISKMVVPTNVTALYDAAAAAAINIAGNLTNAGKIYAFSSNLGTDTATVNAATIFNHRNAVLASAVPTGIPGVQAAVQNLHLNVNATTSLINLGTLSSSGNLNLNTPLLTNHGRINSTSPTGAITVANTAGLTVAGTGTFATGNAGSVTFSVVGPHTLAFTGSQTFDIGPQGTLSFHAKDLGGKLDFGPGIRHLVRNGAAINLSSPTLLLGSGSSLSAQGASQIAVDSGGGMNPLVVVLPKSGLSTMHTTGGTIEFEPTDGHGLYLVKPELRGQGRLALNGGPVEFNVNSSTIHLDDNVTVTSDNTMELNVSQSGGIIGLGFQPYVGGVLTSDNTQVAAWDSYSEANVLQLLQTLQAAGFTSVATYGQGTNTFMNPPQMELSNKWNIQAAHAAGMQIAAGIDTVGMVANCDTCGFNVEDTKAEVRYAIDQALLYPGTVTELIIGNECIWSHTDGSGNEQSTTLGLLLQVMDYAKQYRDSKGFTSATLPITTRQQWGVLAGVNNTTPAYSSIQSQLVTLLTSTVESHVYGNMYAFFDPNIATAIGSSPTQQSFTTAVSTSMSNTLTALQTAFSAQSVTLGFRLGETGWPTSGTQPAQPDAALANTQYAQWYYQAMQTWSTQNNLKVFVFEAFDEPWKANTAASGQPVQLTSSEGYFGLWSVTGQPTPFVPYSFVINSITPKFSLSTAGTNVGPNGPSGLSLAPVISNSGKLIADAVTLNTPNLLNNGEIISTTATGVVAVNSQTSLSVLGDGAFRRTGGGTEAIAFDAAGVNPVVFLGNQMLHAGGTGSVIMNDLNSGSKMRIDADTPQRFFNQVSSMEGESYSLPSAIFCGENFDETNVDTVESSGLKLISHSTGKSAVVKNGRLLLAPSRDISVATPAGTLRVAANSIVLLVRDGQETLVYNLHDSRTNSVSLATSTYSVPVHAGQVAAMTERSSLHRVRSRLNIGYREAKSSQLAENLQVHIAEFSPVGAMAEVEKAYNLRTSTNRKHKALSGKIAKTAAIISMLFANHGPYMPSPESGPVAQATNSGTHSGI